MIIKALTEAQKHCLLLLEIQDARRGWAPWRTLRALGVRSRVLQSLTNAAFIEGDAMATDSTARHTDEWRYRLTAHGERRAAAIRADRAKLKTETAVFDSARWTELREP